MSEPRNHADHLKRAYGLKTVEETQAFYSDWAATYDAEVLENGYLTPARCAEALARHASSRDIALLDMGCGTGLSGASFKAAGFTQITGSEVNPDMLAVARARGVYTHLMLAEHANPFPFAQGTYDAIAAVGVIGAGAAPLSVLDQALDRLGAGGLCVFSFNDHALALPEFPAAIEGYAASGRFEVLESDHGPHLPGKGIGARVYVLRRV